jgi:hypothetical protein
MNAKKQGAIAEQMFATQAMRRGFGVSLPLGDYLPYDVILDNDGILFRIQVKSTTFKEYEAYHFKIGNGQKSKELYSADDLDVFALNIFGSRDFFIIPHQHIGMHKSVRCNINGKYGEYYNNWNVFR